MAAHINATVYRYEETDHLYTQYTQITWQIVMLFASHNKSKGKPYILDWYSQLCHHLMSVQPTQSRSALQHNVTKQRQLSNFTTET